ncbi:hypothetical protein BCR37DRAFT_388037 [Protomyces lactucae-debilis]|uniref:Uncharacterized protein n=1 Tax=Protomyces lactucae-debilis TaxID=2754530 RepID=A0A1Y2FAW1_PROLT|nr:uncharacterized protein BCR37DRAFT_388037 [Protomyces lactucae-debilis]ORY81021.1 hypothetical protein BCR37DRAFT_388037 [Protomyces lactucae-debilis]
MFVFGMSMWVILFWSVYATPLMSSESQSEATSPSVAPGAMSSHAKRTFFWPWYDLHAIKHYWKDKFLKHSKHAFGSNALTGLGVFGSLGMPSVVVTPAAGLAGNAGLGLSGDANLGLSGVNTGVGLAGNAGLGIEDNAGLGLGLAGNTGLGLAGNTGAGSTSLGAVPSLVPVVSLQGTQGVSNSIQGQSQSSGSNGASAGVGLGLDLSGNAGGDIAGSGHALLPSGSTGLSGDVGLGLVGDVGGATTSHDAVPTPASVSLQGETQGTVSDSYQGHSHSFGKSGASADVGIGLGLGSSGSTGGGIASSGGTPLPAGSANLAGTQTASTTKTTDQQNMAGAIFKGNTVKSTGSNAPGARPSDVADAAALHVGTSANLGSTQGSKGTHTAPPSAQSSGTTTTETTTTTTQETGEETTDDKTVGDSTVSGSSSAGADTVNQADSSLVSGNSNSNGTSVR